MRGWRTIVGGVLATSLVAGALLSGCFEKADEGSCEVWVERLKTSAALERAVDQVGRLECAEALPILEQLYEEGQVQERVLQAVKLIGVREGDALEILRMGLRSEHNAKLTASIVAEWKLAAVKPDLIAILEGDSAVSAREAALDALLEIAEPKEFEDALITLAGNDINHQSYLVNTRAVEELGELRSTKAIPTLIEMAYVRSNKGEEVYRAARIALAKVGAPAAEAILTAAKGEHTDLIETLEAMGVQRWEVTQGPKTAQLLVDMQSERALPVMLESFARDLRTPPGLSSKAATDWERSQINRLKVLSFGFGHAGFDAGVEPLLEVVRDPAKAAINQRINGANALAWIGSDAAVTGLIETLEGEGNAAFRPPLAQVVALAVGPEHLDAFRAVTDDPPKDVADALTSNEKLQSYLAVVRECKDSAGCYVGKLASDDRDARIKAAIVLARGKLSTDASIIDALFDTFRRASPDDTDTRRFALMGLTRLGDEGVADRMLEMVTSLDEPNPYWTDELTAFAHWMKARGAPELAPVDEEDGEGEGEGEE